MKLPGMLFRPDGTPRDLRYVLGVAIALNVMALFLGAGILGKVNVFSLVNAGFALVLIIYWPLYAHQRQEYIDWLEQRRRIAHLTAHRKG